MLTSADRFDPLSGFNVYNTKGYTMADIKFRPLHDRVVVRRVESEAKTAGGIIIPDTPPRKSRRKAKSSLLALALVTKQAS